MPSRKTELGLEQDRKRLGKVNFKDEKTGIQRVTCLKSYC